MPRGTLFLVVGPSGAGKDSVMQGARTQLGAEGAIHFARRVITRPSDAGGEEHEAVDSETFRRIASAGGFMLFWRAHDTDYGIPAQCNERLGRGEHVVANVSRTVIEIAFKHFAPVRVIELTAPREVLAGRLAARGREHGARLAGRLDRDVAIPASVPVTRIVNDGVLDEAIAAFLAAVRLA